MITGMGKQGFMCKVCLVCVHKKCVQKLGDFCLRPKTTLVLPANPAVPSPQITPRAIAVSRERQYSQLNLVQLRQAMSELETEEQKAIESVNTKYEEPLAEILEELVSRYKNEVHLVEEQAAKDKNELLAEIRFRENRLRLTRTL